MQLMLVESAQEKAALQKNFYANLCKAWPHKSRNRTVAYPGGKTDADFVIHNGRYCLAAWESDSGKQGWAFKNYFCPYEKSGNLESVLEINISIESINRAGRFARDSVNGACFLMHSGNINIQEHSVKAAEVLDWLEQQGKPVKNASRAKGKSLHRGVIVTRVDSETIGEDIADFIETMTAFKNGVRTGKISFPGF